jgi:hypothetical protein
VGGPPVAALSAHVAQPVGHHQGACGYPHAEPVAVHDATAGTIGPPVGGLDAGEHVGSLLGVEGTNDDGGFGCGGACTWGAVVASRIADC